jgi:uncharacterized membrane protein
MKLIEFNSPDARHIYEDYIKRSKKQVAVLSEAEQEECLMEINSHIYEALQSEGGDNEVENLRNILKRLGMPEEIFPDIVAEIKINQAIKTYNPKHLVHALLLNIRRGFIYVLLSILTLFLATFPILLIMKLILPQHTGLFIGDGSVSFGVFRNHEGMKEILGYWFIPIVVLLFTLLYFLIFLLLKQTKRIKR